MIVPLWVITYRRLGSRMTALMEECAILQDQLGDALCRGEELDEATLRRICELENVSFGVSEGLPK